MAAWGIEIRRLALLAGVIVVAPGAVATSFAQTVIPYNNGDLKGAPIVLIDPLGTRLQVLTGSAEQSGPILGARQLAKTGAGELVLSGVNTNTGITSVLDGTLTAISDLALSDKSAFQVNKGATLKLDDSGGFLDAAIGSLSDGPSGGGNVDIGVDSFTFLAVGYDNKSTTFSGIITGAGSFGKVGTGTLTLTGKGSYIGGLFSICDCKGVGGVTFAGGSLSAAVVEIDGGGRLSITNGGSLEGRFATLFDGGTVLVDGRGSALKTKVLLSQDTSISVKSGGSLTQTDVNQGMLLLDSKMSIDGTGSKVIVAGVDQLQQSNVVISNGGRHQAAGIQSALTSITVKSGGVIIQTNPLFGIIFDSGKMLVDGRGSLVDIAGTTEFSTFFGSVDLTVSNGAVFRSRKDASLEGFAGGPGFPPLTATATVTGAGSLWTIGDELFVGCKCGPATLNVANGGEVRAVTDIVLGGGSILNLGLGGLAGKVVTPLIKNAGKIIANFTDTSTLNAVISGLGTLTKNGSGKLILTAVNTYTGATTVNKGILSINGSIGNSAVTVNDGGTLAGNGTVGTTVVKAGGTISPGNSIGTLTVRNGLTLAAGSRYKVEVGNGSDLIKVIAGPGGTGKATLGGSVTAIYGTSGQVKTSVLILTTTGGVKGTFTGVTDNLATVVTSLKYDSKNVYLVSKLSLSGINGLTINQTNVANAIDDFFAGKSSFDLAFAKLGPAALTTISGEIGTSAIQSGFIASDRFMDVISDRFVLAGGSPGSVQPEASAYAMSDTAGSVATGAYAALLDKKSAYAMGASGQWKPWGAAYGATADLDGDETTVGSHDLGTDLWGLASGIGWGEGDRSFGIALGGGHSTFDLADGLGSGDAGLFNAGVYGRAEFGDAYFLAAAAYGYQDVSTSRSVFGDNLEGSYDSHSFSGRGELGYRFNTPVAGLTPYAAFQGTSLRIPSYSETSSGAGTYALTYDGRSATDARGELGLRFDKTMALSDSALFVLTGRAAWAHSSGGDRSLVAGFQSLPGTSFTVYGAEPARDSALLDVGAKLALNNGLSASVMFQGQFADGYSLYSGSVKLGFSW